jgi:phage shock protein C
MNSLYRSKHDRVIAGVAGGLGRYLKIDPVLVRLFFVLLTLSNGIGLLLYVVLAIVVPEAPESEELQGAGEHQAVVESDAGRTKTIMGGGLLLLGMFFLLQTFNVPFFAWIRLEELWPLLLIVAGGTLLWRQYGEQHQGG